MRNPRPLPLLLAACMFLGGTLSSFQPPIYPCNPPGDLSAVDEGYYSPGWFEETNATAVGWVGAAVDQLSATQWYGNYPFVFSGVGPYGQTNRLSVSRDNFAFNGVSRSVFEWIPYSFGSGLFTLNSAGFLPMAGDEWFFVTSNESPVGHVFYGPGLSVAGATWFAALPQFLSGESLAMLGCSAADSHSGGARVTMVCMIADISTLDLAQVVKFSFTPQWDGVAAGVADPQFEGSFIATYTHGQAQKFPVHLAMEPGEAGLSSGFVYYRCDPTVASPGRVWCVRGFTGVSTFDVGEKVKVTTSLALNSDAGMFLGNVGGGSNLDYYLDRGGKVLYTLRRAPHDTPDDFRTFAFVDSPFPDAPYFSGHALYIPSLQTHRFQLSAALGAYSFARAACVPCALCGEGEYSSTRCETERNVDQGCRACSVCAQYQYRNASVECGGDRDTDCVDCRFHVTPCELDLFGRCQYQECPDGEVLLTRCDGSGHEDTSSCGVCNITCGFNEYIGRGCVCEQCSTRSGSCAPGYHIQACDGTKNYDDSRCVECEFHYPTRLCGNHRYMASYCETGDDISDVSECLPCRSTPDNCGGNDLFSVYCPFNALEDTSECFPCTSFVDSGLVAGNYFSGKPCIYTPCRPEEEFACGPDEIVTGCDGTTAVDDRRCAPKPFTCGPECSVTEYVSTVCNHTSRIPRNCTGCSLCPDDQFASVPCSGAVDTQCADCSPRVPCAEGVEFWKNCSQTSDGRCQTCTAAFCEPWQYSRGCKGTSDYYCVNCTELSCPAGEYRTRCGGLEDSRCEQCSPPCAANEWEEVPCTETTNRVCRPCTTDCGLEFFIAKECTATENTVCTRCSIPCEAGVTWEERPCDPTSTLDRVCSPCTNCADANLPELSPCITTQNAVCDGEAACLPDDCPANQYFTGYGAGCVAPECTVCGDTDCAVNNGTTTYRLRDCTDFGNENCAACDTSCSVEQFRAAECDEDSNIVCEQCSGICPANEFLSAACGAFTDRRCSECDPPCFQGQYQTQECDPFNNRQCRACSFCPQGRFRSVANAGCAGEEDTNCVDCRAPCGPTEWESVPCTHFSDRQCTACSTFCPGVGLYRLEECSATRDIVCAPCSVGWCDGGQYRSAPCTPTADQVCTVCQSCVFGETYDAGGCRFDQDRDCRPCTTDVPQGFYVAKNCTTEADTQFALFSQQCHLRVPRAFETRAPSETRDRECRVCRDCGLNAFEVAECTQYQDTQCQYCGEPCGSGYYESAPCTPAGDHVCTRCTQCPEGEFLFTGCSGDRDSVCVPCTTSCPDGQTLVSPCTNTSNIVCQYANQGLGTTDDPPHPPRAQRTDITPEGGWGLPPRFRFVRPRRQALENIRTGANTRTETCRGSSVGRAPSF